jgi:WD40 repeat protein
MKHIFVQLLAALSLLISSLASAQVDPLFEKAGELPIEHSVQSLAWHPNGKWLAIGYYPNNLVEVWDIQTKQSILKMASKRVLGTKEQDILFSANGKYMVVRDLVDTGGPYIKPKNDDDPLELKHQKDTQRLILARIWDLEAKKEVAEIRGAGSRLHGGTQHGMCFVSGQSNEVTLLRNSMLSVYNIPSGKKIRDIDIRRPFKDKPNFKFNYWHMACHPNRPELAVNGIDIRRPDDLAELGLSVAENAVAWPMPLVVVDMQRGQIKKTFISPTGIGNKLYIANGKLLAGLRDNLVRFWDANDSYKQLDDLPIPTMDAKMNPRAIPNFQGLVTTGNGLQIWNVKDKNLAYRTKLPPIDVPALAIHEASGLFALPLYHNAISFFKLDIKKLLQSTQQ